MKPQPCPVCSTPLDPHFESGAPSPGDLSVCRCGLILIFDGDLTLRPANPEEIERCTQEELDTLKRAHSALRRSDDFVSVVVALNGKGDV